MPEARVETRLMQLRVVLAEDLANAYQRQAEFAAKPIEQVLADRLAASLHHAAAKPIYFDDSERQELERMLGKNVLSSRDVLIQIRNALSVRLGNVRITLQPGLLARLKSRCIGMKWDEYLEKIVVENLERYAGMR